MSELHNTLRTMGFMQLLLAFVFLTSYAVALSSLTGATGRKRAGAAALFAAIGFAAMTQPWVHGVLLLAFAVAGLGVFMGSAWALSSFFGLAAGKTQHPDSIAGTAELHDFPVHTEPPSHAERAHTV